MCAIIHLLVKCVLDLNIIEHFADAEDNKESVAKGKLTMPVLVLSDVFIQL